MEMQLNYNKYLHEIKPKLLWHFEYLNKQHNNESCTFLYMLITDFDAVSMYLRLNFIYLKFKNIILNIKKLVILNVVKAWIYRFAL